MRRSWGLLCLSGSACLVGLPQHVRLSRPTRRRAEADSSFDSVMENLDMLLKDLGMTASETPTADRPAEVIPEPATSSSPPSFWEPPQAEVIPEPATSSPAPSSWEAPPAASDSTQGTWATPERGPVVPADGEGALALRAMGLRPAPAEYGSGMFLASAEEINQVVAVKVQKIQASLNALKRYTSELENELLKKEEQLDQVQAELDQERFLRQQAEEEKEALQQRKASLEISLVESDQVQKSAQSRVLEIDRQAEEVSEQLYAGKITEDEAEKIEDELIRAQAKLLAAQQSTSRSQQEFQQVSQASDEAARRAAAAQASEQRLRQELEAMRSAVESAKAEAATEAAKRAEADSRFNQLVQRIKAKADG